MNLRNYRSVSWSIILFLATIIYILKAIFLARAEFTNIILAYSLSAVQYSIIYILLIRKKFILERLNRVSDFCFYTGILSTIFGLNYKLRFIWLLGFILISISLLNAKNRK